MSIVLPDDLEYVEKVLILSPPNPYRRKELMIENESVYVPQDFEGTLRISYQAIPILVDSLDDAISVNAVSQVAMAYGLAKLLVAPEGNDYLIAFLAGEFEKQKGLIAQRKPASFEKVINHYGNF